MLADPEDRVLANLRRLSVACQIEEHCARLIAFKARDGENGGFADFPISRIGSQIFQQRQHALVACAPQCMNRGGAKFLVCLIADDVQEKRARLLAAVATQQLNPGLFQALAGFRAGLHHLRDVRKTALRVRREQAFERDDFYFHIVFVERIVLVERIVNDALIAQVRRELNAQGPCVVGPIRLGEIIEQALQLSVRLAVLFLLGQSEGEPVEGCVQILLFRIIRDEASEFAFGLRPFLVADEIPAFTKDARGGSILCLNEAIELLNVLLRETVAEDWPRSG